MWVNHWTVCKKHRNYAGLFFAEKVYQDLVFHIGDEGAYSRQPFLWAN